MKPFAEIVLGALILAAAAVPADAGISVGIGIGPGYYSPSYGVVSSPPYSTYCDRSSRWYSPARCSAHVHDRNYYRPIHAEPLHGDIRFSGFGRMFHRWSGPAGRTPPNQ